MTRGGHRSKRLRPGKCIYMHLACPKELDVATQVRRPHAIAFFQAIRRHSRQRGVVSILDFQQLEKIYPAGAVLLMAEVHRALAGAATHRPIEVKRPIVPLMDEVLQQIGVYELVGVRCSSAPRDESVVHWMRATGTLSEGAKGGSILESYSGRLAPGLDRGLYEGIVEAMTNTLHHAYEGEEGNRLRRSIGRRWWMLSQEKDGRLTVAICDLGIGIPRSLPRSRTFGVGIVRRAFDRLGLERNDANAIRVALELGKTRTLEPGRGKGLAEIVEAVNLSEGGGVHISSNRGVYTDGEGQSLFVNEPHSICGTLIYWVVPVREGHAPDGAKSD